MDIFSIRRLRPAALVKAEKQHNAQAYCSKTGKLQHFEGFLLQIITKLHFPLSENVTKVMLYY